MASLQLFLVLFLTFSYIPFLKTQQCVSPLRLTVDNVEGVDNESCLEGLSSNCSSLDYVLGHLQENKSSVCADVYLVPTNQSYNLSFKDFIIRGSVSLQSTSSQKSVRIECTSDHRPYGCNDTLCSKNVNVTSVLRIEDGAEVTLERLNFSNCQRPIRFENLDQLTLKYCSFSKFATSAVALQNIQDILVENCQFSDSFAALHDVRFRGSAGALSVHYDSSPYSLSTVNVVDTEFFRNKAGTGNTNNVLVPGTSESLNLRLQTLNSGTFFGRGGAMGVFILNPPNVTTVNLTVDSCLFVNNTAEALGGAIYMVPFGENVEHNFTFRNSAFVENSATEVGGGFFIGFPSRFDSEHHITVRVEDCKFVGNKANASGGMGVIQAQQEGSGQLVIISNTVFENNWANSSGAAVQFASHARLLVFEADNYFYVVDNCTFTRNKGISAFTANYIHTEFRGDNVFENNNGICMEVLASLIRLTGTIRFENNTVDTLRGGALFITILGQIQMMRESRMEFIRNRGRVGAAIVVQVQEYSFPLSDLAMNPQCFLVFEDPQTSPESWENVNILFLDNTAQVGSVIHASFLNICSWYSNNITTNIFDINVFLNWTVFNYGTNYNLGHNNGTEESQYYVQTEAVRITLDQDTLTLWPGQFDTLSVNIEDQYGNPTYVILRLIDEKLSFFDQTSDDTGGGNSQNAQVITASPSLFPLMPPNNSIRFHINLPNGFDKDLKEMEYNATFLVDAPYNVRNLNNTARVNVIIQPCPPGYNLGKPAEGSDGHDGRECECARIPSIIQCSQEPNIIVLQEDLWVGKYSKADYSMVFKSCPQPHCVCRSDTGLALMDCLTVYDDSDPDSQCFNNRTGILCGRCPPETGTGVLTTDCKEPVPYGYLFFIPIIVFQVVVVLLMVILGVRIPAVLKGLLFYIQVVPYLTNFFPSSFWEARQFLYCFTSLVALYFPWDFSLWDGMPALVTFLFVYEIWVVSAIVIAIIMLIRTRYRTRFMSGIWSLVLMTSGIILYTSFGLLHCVDIPLDMDEGKVPWTRRWYYDGNVTCFTGWHIPLGLLAIAVLLCYAAFTVLLFVYTIKRKLKHPKKFGDFLDAVHRGYKEGMEWYGPFELLRRFVLISFVVYMPGVSVFPICVVFLLFLVHMYAHPYQFWWQNTVETINFCILLTLLLFRSVALTEGILFIPGRNEVSVPKGNSLPEVDELSGFFLFWYYLPLAVAVVMTSVVGIYRLWNGPFGKKLKAKKEITTTEKETNEEPRPTSAELSLVGSNVELVTFSVVAADDDDPKEIEPVETDD